MMSMPDREPGITASELERANIRRVNLLQRIRVAFDVAETRMRNAEHDEKYITFQHDDDGSLLRKILLTEQGKYSSVAALRYTPRVYVIADADDDLSDGHSGVPWAKIVVKTSKDVEEVYELTAEGFQHVTDEELEDVISEFEDVEMDEFGDRISSIGLQVDLDDLDAFSAYFRTLRIAEYPPKEI